MSDSLVNWSDGPYAPQVPYAVYAAEKEYFAGALIGAVFYGIVIVLFFRCMSALLHPTHCAREGVRWGLVAYTVTVFSFVTILTTMNLNLGSISYIDDREFSGHGVAPPGPYGYEIFIYSKAISLVPNLMFLLNNWLADGVLLYRCCVIYATDYWAISFPCLMYLASLATGIMYIYYQASQSINQSSVAISFDYPYFAISLGLNLLLTFMIVMRLVLRSRSIRNAMGAPAITTGLSKAVLTMLVESSALYAVSFLLFIVPWAAGSSVSGIFLPILADIQVIAPFLIIIRIADRSAITSDTLSGSSGSGQSMGQGELASSNEIPPDGSLTASVDAPGKTPGELGIEVETVVDVHFDGA